MCHAVRQRPACPLSRTMLGPLLEDGRLSAKQQAATNLFKNQALSMNQSWCLKSDLSRASAKHLTLPSPSLTGLMVRCVSTPTLTRVKAQGRAAISSQPSLDGETPLAKVEFCFVWAGQEQRSASMQRPDQTSGIQHSLSILARSFHFPLPQVNQSLPCLCISPSCLLPFPQVSYRSIPFSYRYRWCPFPGAAMGLPNVAPVPCAGTFHKPGPAPASKVTVQLTSDPTSPLRYLRYRGLV